MSKFSYENKINKGKSSLPLGKRIKRFIFNAKSGFLRDAGNELSSVHLSDRVFK
jgi:hypothetical protein